MQHTSTTLELPLSIKHDNNKKHLSYAGTESCDTGTIPTTSTNTVDERPGSDPPCSDTRDNGNNQEGDRGCDTPDAQPQSNEASKSSSDGDSSDSSDSSDSATAAFSPPSENEEAARKPQHEQIDARIARQKEKYWKKLGKNADPRIAALVPIHAPKMERLSRLQALKQRAALKPQDREGDIVTGIIHEINKTADINYSIVPVAANFAMEKDLGEPVNSVTIMATNDPNSTRPKPPTIKQRRQNRLIPFPQRQKQAKRQQDRRAENEESGSNVESEASWPTDTDEAIPRFGSNKKKSRKQPVKVNKKAKQVKKPKKAKKLTKMAVTAMVYKIRDPIPMTTWDKTLKIEAARARKLVRDQKIRMRQRECRARNKLKKAEEASKQQHDVLAQAINLSNILAESDEDDGIVDFLRSLDNQEQIISPYNTEEEETEHGLNDSIEAHIERIAEQHMQEEIVNQTDSDSDNDWKTGNQVYRNPFASTEKTSPLRPAAPTVHQGYFTEQGLQKQRKKLAAIRRDAGIKSSSVLIHKLRSTDISHHLGLRVTNPVVTPEEEAGQAVNMSAKNITKDRSGSRGRSDKQDRFTKGRGEQEPEPENMEHDQANEDGQDGAQSKSKGNGKRQRDPPRTGRHDNTTTEDSDEEIPGAKRNMTSLREKLTHVYQKKTKETREKWDDGKTTPSVQLRVDTTHAGEKVKSTTVPLLEPIKLADAPTLSLKDLVPEQDKYGIESQGQDESFKADRIEFVVVEREFAIGEETAPPGSDRDYEWEIPERNFFDAIMGQAIEKYTEEDWDRIDYLTFSSVGWNTGVGLFAFGSDKLEQMNIFRQIIRTLKIGNKCFESYPKRMLLNRYALTIYFNAAFQWNSELKLLFFIKKLNGFKGELTMAETRFYPEDHPTRKGCKIVACEADQQFLDELYKYPKDHAFSIRFGGNLYIRGGESIDPDDPDAVRQRRPKLTRTAAKKFIQGSGEDILSDGQRMDDEAAKAARDEHMRKYVGFLLLFTYHTRYRRSRVSSSFVCMAFLGGMIGKKQRTLLRYIRESKQIHIESFIARIGHETVKRAYKLCTACMNVRIVAKNGEQCITKYQYLTNYYGGQCRPNDSTCNENDYELKPNYVSTIFPGKAITTSPTWAINTVIFDNTISKNKYRRLCLIIILASFNLFIKEVLYTNRQDKGIKNRVSLRTKSNKHNTNYTSLSRNIGKDKYVRDHGEPAMRRLISLVNAIRIKSANYILFHTICLKYKKGRSLVRMYGACRTSVLKYVKNHGETTVRRLISLVNVIRIESTNCMLFHTICQKNKKGRGLVRLYGVCRRSVFKINSCNSNKVRSCVPKLNAVIL